MISSQQKYLVIIKSRCGRKKHRAAAHNTRSLRVIAVAPQDASLEAEDHHGGIGIGGEEGTKDRERRQATSWVGRSGTQKEKAGVGDPRRPRKRKGRQEAHGKLGLRIRKHEGGSFFLSQAFCFRILSFLTLFRRWHQEREILWRLAHIRVACPVHGLRLPKSD